MSDRLTPEQEPMLAPAEPGEPVCTSVHWDLPVECVLPRTHRENWHVGANPLTGSWFRYRYPIRATHELVDGRWVDRTEPKPDRLTPEREAEIAAHLKSTTNWSLGNLAARDLLAELAAVRAERDLAQRKVASLKAEQDRDDAEYAEAIAERDSAREALREACDQIAALESDLGGATARIAELEAERLTQNQALDDAVRELRTPYAERARRERHPGRRQAWLMLASAQEAERVADVLLNPKAARSAGKGPQPSVEGEHYASVHHDYRLGHDLDLPDVEQKAVCRCGEPDADPYACEADDCEGEFSELNPFGGSTLPVEKASAEVSKTCGCGWRTSVWHVDDGSAEEELHRHVVRVHGGTYTQTTEEASA